MASLSQLRADVLNWMNRQDVDAANALPSWVNMAELEMAETLRARCQVKSATQAIDAPIITLPPDFATMESIRDNTTGELLDLEDEWTGHWTTGRSSMWVQGAVVGIQTPATAYRLVEDCIEFLPHPPQPLPDGYVAQQVLMRWYQKPAPLLLPTDTNVVLEALYPVYLFGVLRYGAIWAKDDAGFQSMDTQWQAVVTRANLWKQQSDYSGAPMRSEMAVTF